MKPAVRPAQVLLLMGALAPVAARAEDPAGLEFFEKRIRPVLVRNCYECHSTASVKLKGGLLLDSREGSRRGGDSGPAVVPGNVEESLLIAAVRHDSFGGG
ncbi:MAG TPA: c-type cytochrome domain-containing protein, partial [Pirellulales bacterium]|nr:c-type cytochrome domain-containing protein [Pirellulales bacterium]